MNHRKLPMKGEDWSINYKEGLSLCQDPSVKYEEDCNLIGAVFLIIVKKARDPKTVKKKIFLTGEGL